MNLFMDWPYNTIDFLSVKKQAQDIVFHYLKEISNIEGSLEAHPGLNFIYNFFLENINLDNTLKTEYGDYMAFQEVIGSVAENYFDN